MICNPKLTYIIDKADCELPPPVQGGQGRTGDGLVSELVAWMVVMAMLAAAGVLIGMYWSGK